jgi:hypothetical protein
MAIWLRSEGCVDSTHSHTFMRACRNVSGKRMFND